MLIELKDKGYFFASQSFRTGTTDSIHLEMLKISQEDLLKEIRKLDSSN
jgi:hypothetical protein